MIVVDGIVESSAVVPKGNASYFPLEPTRELRLHLMLEQIFQQRCALLCRPAVEPFCMSDIDVYALVARLWMRPYSWVIGHEVFGCVPRVFDAV
jgi:hypothetical protein